MHNLADQSTTNVNTYASQRPTNLNNLTFLIITENTESLTHSSRDHVYVFIVSVDFLGVVPIDSSAVGWSYWWMVCGADGRFGDNPDLLQ